MAGTFDLKTPRDLLGKLGRELERLRSSPLDTDHAFNFFVTAEHMLDWLHPGAPGRPARSAARNGEILLEVVSHLANGAKHFDLLNARHDSVADTEHNLGGPMSSSFRSGGFGGPFGSSFGGPFSATGYAPPRLIVRLAGGAVSALGSDIDAVVLAERVFAYWSAPGRLPA
jgi:hypothetical protein